MSRMEEFGGETSQLSHGLGKNVEKPVLGKMLMAIKEENKRGPEQVFENTPTQPCMAGEDRGKLQ